MKIISVFLIIIFMAGFVFADRVCIRKSDGRPLDYQSGDAPLGTLTQNCINAGFGQVGDFEEKYVSKQEYQQIKEAWDKNPVNPVVVKNKEKEKTKKEKEDKIKTKLGLSDKDFEDLKEALN